MRNRTSSSQNPPRIAWSALMWAVLLLFLAVQAAQLALYLGRWPAPVRYVSIVVLLVIPWLLWRGLQRFLRWGRTLTLKRIVIGFLIAFAVVVFFVGMNNPSEHGPLRSFQDATISISRTAGQLASNGFAVIVRFPGQMWITYTDHSIIDGELGELSAQNLTIVNDEKISPIEIPATVPSQSLEAELGDQVLTSSLAASLCKMATLSTGPFPQGTRVTLVEGPRILENAWWWRVQSEKAAGWCPNTALVNVRGKF